MADRAGPNEWVSLIGSVAILLLFVIVVGALILGST